MPLLREITAVLEQIAPTRNAASWDNVGLLVGDTSQQVRSAMCTIDYTQAVADEARSLNCDLVIAYHPPIFQPVKRLRSGDLVYEAIRRGTAIYSPHTAFDAADGGTNDVLADVLGLENRTALKLNENKASECKLATFVPAEVVDRVAEAMFAAGAGRIGNYSSCSFRSAGTGTFFGEAGTQPAVGQSNRLETANEIRLETIVPLSKVSAVVAAMRKVHPYEEPAFDLNALHASPTGIGMGRVGTLPAPMQRSELISRLKKELGLNHVLVAGPSDGLAQRVAVCAGACGDLLDDAIAAKAEVYVTGEMRHHDALKASAAGLTVVCTLHSNSERISLKRLKQRVESALPELAVHLSQADRDPFAVC